MHTTDSWAWPEWISSVPPCSGLDTGPQTALRNIRR